VSVKSWLGIDAVDLAIHAGITFCVMGFVGVSNGPDGLYPVITMGSIIALAIRRKIGLRRSIEPGAEADRLAEVEDRLHYVEGLQDRVIELEERLDFAERLLAQSPKERLPG
jgi:hypothetical protein